MPNRDDKSGSQWTGFPARFRDALTLDLLPNKPDSKDAHLTSPVSTLNPRVSSFSAAATPATSSGSSSSGSVSANPNSTQFAVADTYSADTSFTSPAAGEKLRSTSSSFPSTPGHRRSASLGSPLIYSGKGFHGSASGSNAAVCSGCNGASSAAVSSSANFLPAGNICPSGKIAKPVIASPVLKTARHDVLGSGTRNYGHGSIMRGHARFGSSGSSGEVNVADAAECSMVKKAMVSLDPEEVKSAGNEMYRKGNFVEALGLYDRAISMCPENASLRSNKGAALAALGRLGEAVIECEEAVRLDYGYLRAHQRLAALYIRLGFVEQARSHLCLPGHQPDPTEKHKLLTLEKHLKQCADAREIEDWKSALRECDAAIAAGGDCSPQLTACKSEALLKLYRLDEAESTLSKISNCENGPLGSQAKVFGMIADAYVLHVRAQLEMALGRFENAVSLADNAGLVDSGSPEVISLMNKVKLVANARSHGNNLFKLGKYAEARLAYGDGLKYDLFSSVLYCNRAVCWSKLGMWKQCVEDCNQALKVQPHYTKALLRRAVSNEKLQRWAEAVRDYEALRIQLPGDNEVAESLSKAQLALKKFQEDDMKFSGEVEKITSISQFKAALSSSSSHGVSVVYFKEASNQQCEQISPFVNTLCLRYPSLNFLKVYVEECPAIARTESIKIIPTFKIYKHGCEVKQMVSPSHQVLENAVMRYSL